PPHVTHLPAPHPFPTRRSSDLAVASANGLGLLGSGLTESGIGFTASLHLFATLSTLLPPELNGVQFLNDMLVSGLEVEGATARVDRKSTRLNSSHDQISYAVFC